MITKTQTTIQILTEMIAAIDKVKLTQPEQFRAATALERAEYVRRLDEATEK